MLHLKNASRALGTAILFAATMGLSSPVYATQFTYAMFDHPNGTEADNFQYGLRLDNLGMFFSAGPNAASSTVTLVYDDDAKTMSLTGTLMRNAADGSLDGTEWALNYSFSGLTVGTSGLVPTADFGAFDGTNGSVISTLVEDTLLCTNCIGAEEDMLIRLGAKAKTNNPEGLFFGFGLPDTPPDANGVNDEFNVVRGNVITGTGWVMPSGATANKNCCNDFLLAGAVAPQLNPIPLPAGLPLLAAGIGAFAVIGWRKRKTA